MARRSTATTTNSRGGTRHHSAGNHPIGSPGCSPVSVLPLPPTCLTSTRWCTQMAVLNTSPTSSLPPSPLSPPPLFSPTVQPFHSFTVFILEEKGVWEDAALCGGEAGCEDGEWRLCRLTGEALQAYEGAD
ncbi:hypothetical protein SESBI_04460 [Sesbania bispinosa]|nr:hypothetical protein SESBI_04460 [Sesbania bispinosa]